MTTTTTLLSEKGGKNKRILGKNPLICKSPLVNVGSDTKMLMLNNWHAHCSHIMVQVVNALGGQGESRICDGRSERRASIDSSGPKSQPIKQF